MLVDILQRVPAETLQAGVSLRARTVNAMTTSDNFGHAPEQPMGHTLTEDPDCTLSQ